MARGPSPGGNIFWIPTSWEAMKPKPRLSYDIRHQAQRALLELRPEHAGAPPREPVEAIAELTALLKTDLSKPEDNLCAWNTLDLISKVKSGPASAAVLVEALGHPASASHAAKALTARTDSAEVMAVLNPLLARPDLKPETLAMYLQIVQRHQPAAAPALARRLVERMKTADDRGWEDFPHTIGEVLRATLRAEDLPVLDRLADHLGSAAAADAKAAKEKYTKATGTIMLGSLRLGENPAPTPETEERRRASSEAAERARREKKRREAVLELKEEILGHPPAKAALTKKELLDLDAARLSSEPRARTVEILLTALQQPRDRKWSMEDHEVYEAAYQLGVLRERAAVPTLLTLLDGHLIAGYGGEISATTPGMAAWALIQIADPASIPELRKWTERSLDEFEKKQGTVALIAYGALAGEEAIPALTKILKMPPDEGYAKDEWRMAGDQSHVRLHDAAVAEANASRPQPFLAARRRRLRPEPDEEPTRPRGSAELPRPRRRTAATRRGYRRGPFQRGSERTECLVPQDPGSARGRASLGAERPAHRRRRRATAVLPATIGRARPRHSRG